MLLPNLSLLSIDGNKRDSPEEDGEEDGEDGEEEERLEEFFIVPSTAVPINQFSWSNLFQELKRDPTLVHTFTVSQTDFNGEKQTVTFTASLIEDVIENTTDIRIKINGISSRNGNEIACVDVIYDGRELKLDSLFHGRDDDELETCAMNPKHGDRPGAGEFVLSILKNIAASIGAWITLSDAARPIERSMPLPTWMQSDIKLTEILSITRGYGYYQARGFLSEYVVNDVHGEYEAEMLSSPFLYREAFKLANVLLLSWTHAFMTTPISDIPLMMRTQFHKLVQEKLGSHPQFKTRHPLKNVFSLPALSRQANKIEEIDDGETSAFGRFTAELEIFQKDHTTRCGRQLSGSFTKLSIRRLVQLAAVDNLLFDDDRQDLINSMLRVVSNFIGDAWAYVDGYPIFKETLKCPLFLSLGGSQRYDASLAVGPPMLPGYAPISNALRFNTDFTVAFENDGSMPPPPAKKPKLPAPLLPSEKLRDFIQEL